MIQLKKYKKELLQGMSFTIDINKLNLNRRKFTTSEIGRGTGIEKIKKEKALTPARMSTLMTYLTGVFVYPMTMKVSIIHIFYNYVNSNMKNSIVRRITSSFIRIR